MKLILCEINNKFNEKYVKSTLNSTQNVYDLGSIQRKIFKIYANFNAKYVRSTLNSTQNIWDLR